MTDRAYDEKRQIVGPSDPKMQASLYLEVLNAAGAIPHGEIPVLPQDPIEKVLTLRSGNGLPYRGGTYRMSTFRKKLRTHRWSSVSAQVWDVELTC